MGKKEKEKKGNNGNVRKDFVYLKTEDGLETVLERNVYVTTHIFGNLTSQKRALGLVVGDSLIEFDDDAELSQDELERILETDDRYLLAKSRLYQDKKTPKLAFFLQRLGERFGGVDGLYQKLENFATEQSARGKEINLVEKSTFTNWYNGETVLLLAQNKPLLQAFEGMDAGFDGFIDDLLDQPKPGEEEMSLANMHSVFRGQRISAGQFRSRYNQVLNEEVAANRQGNEQAKTSVRARKEAILSGIDFTPAKIRIQKYLESKDRRYKIHTIIELKEISKEKKDEFDLKHPEKRRIVTNHEIESDNITRYLKVANLMMFISDVANYYLRNYLRDKFKQADVSPSYMPDILNMMLLRRGFNNPYFKQLSKKYQAEISANFPVGKRLAKLQDLATELTRDIAVGRVDAFYSVSTGTFNKLVTVYEAVFSKQEKELWELRMKRYKSNMPGVELDEQETQSMRKFAVQWYNLMRSNRFAPNYYLFKADSKPIKDDARTVVDPQGDWYGQWQKTLNENDLMQGMVKMAVLIQGGRFISRELYTKIMHSLELDELLALAHNNYFVSDNIPQSEVMQSDRVVESQLQDERFVDFLVMGQSDDYVSNPTKSLVEPAGFINTIMQRGNLASLGGKDYSIISNLLWENPTHTILEKALGLQLPPGAIVQEEMTVFERKPESK
ncbi:TPA: hypothetical protein HA246_00320 [Candidatus Woesearchaeota archaeon]|nr:hypothetical protein [Candidatus Woesearchaeota archaeon]